MNEKEKELKKTEYEKKNPDYFTVIPAIVRYDDKLRANEKILYSEILTLSRKNGYCYASNKYLSDLYGVSITIISRWINSLIKYGYLVSENEYKAGTNYILRRKLYPTNVKDILNKSSTYIEQTFNNDIEQKFKDNNTSINDMNNKKSNNSRADEKNDELIDQVVNYLNEKTGKDFKATTKQTVSLIKARARDGNSFDDFKKVIDTKTNQWLSNPDMNRYLRPQTLFGNKFEAYREEYSNNNGFNNSNEINKYDW
ncbi:Conserved phage C-terminus (Phg_2220_C) [Anaerococcus octavius]|uniref:Conserved phage C-terminus (Phg_2220_C) n=1 Tax=Anaerococcus octavius TaxID=54007 RepID=A0A380WV86_9FIRM|nr:conserved phage C-terminal domain-containing protein [Anaerococcus octavius]SUU92194.1 Conserved phage C-terminus (Phg_2220_C) [Anaerococcus octavius]